MAKSDNAAKVRMKNKTLRMFDSPLRNIARRWLTSSSSRRPHADEALHKAGTISDRGPWPRPNKRRLKSRKYKSGSEKPRREDLQKRSGLRWESGKRRRASPSRRQTCSRTDEP